MSLHSCHVLGTQLKLEELCIHQGCILYEMCALPAAEIVLSAQATPLPEGMGPVTRCVLE